MPITGQAIAAIKQDIYDYPSGDGLDGAVLRLMGETTVLDIAPTLWRYDKNSSAADNYSAGVIKPTDQSANGRWIRFNDNQLQSDWNQVSNTALDYIKNKPAVLGAPTVTSIAAGARNFNTVYQVSATNVSEIKLSAQISASLSLAGGQGGEIFLEYSSDGTTGWTLAGVISGSNTGTLTIGLNTVQVTGGMVSAWLPVGYRWRLRTNNTTGTPTYTFT